MALSKSGEGCCRPPAPLAHTPMSSSTIHILYRITDFTDSKPFHSVSLVYWVCDQRESECEFHSPSLWS